MKRFLLYIGISATTHNALATNVQLNQATYNEATLWQSVSFKESLVNQQQAKAVFNATKELAEQGNIDAKNNLGFLYQRGFGTDKNLSESIRLYEEAANSGHEGAQNNLGYMYLNGLFVKKNYSIAADWYKKSADQGCAKALENLGYMHNNNFLGKINYEKAAYFYELAVKQNLNSAKRSLAHLYISGHGVKKDEQYAIKLMQESAKNGDVRAQRDLGSWYRNLKFIYNSDYAIRCYTNSAKQGYDKAQYELGKIYEHGDSNLKILKSHKTAIKWYRQAALQGNFNAFQGMKRLQKSPNWTGFPKSLLHEFEQIEKQEIKK